MGRIEKISKLVNIYASKVEGIGGGVGNYNMNMIVITKHTPHLTIDYIYVLYPSP